MWLFCVRLPVKWRGQGTCDSPLVWLPWSVFCKDQKHCQAVWLHSKRWEWRIMPKEQKVRSRRMRTAIKPRGWNREKNRERGRVEQPQAVGGSECLTEQRDGQSPTRSTVLWETGCAQVAKCVLLAWEEPGESNPGKGPFVPWLSGCSWRGI